MIRARLQVSETQRIPLDRALGAVLREEVVCTEAVPPFRNSAMDGFAVRSEDLDPLGGTLSVVGQIQAGQWPERSVGPGECLAIMTGAPFPDGADAVVPVEWTRMDGGKVTIDRGIERGKHVRPAGEDLAPGDTVASTGRRIDSSLISALSSAGKAEVTVGRIPSVAVVSTGDELVSAGHPLKPGQIRNSNGPALSARVLECGAVLWGHLHARDDRRDIERVIKEALEADVLVISGGVSMGKYDLVRDVLLDRGLEMAFWKVRQRPGKPLAFGTLEGKPVFGLPGNPVSSAICFDQYVRPALIEMQGGTYLLRKLRALLGEPFGKPAGLHVFARGVLTQDAYGILHVLQAGSQGSNLAMSLVRANCLVHLPEDWDQAPTGAQAEIEMT